MTEHMYFQSNNNFPTLARGLFTEEVDGEERIVARGYDKFFNTDEVAWSYVSLHVCNLLMDSGTECNIIPKVHTTLH